MDIGKFLKILVNKYKGIHVCLGPSDPLTDFGGILVNPGSVCLLFRPKNPLIDNGGIVVKSSVIDEHFRPINTLTSNVRICGKS